MTTNNNISKQEEGPSFLCELFAVHEIPENYWKSRKCLREMFN